MLDANLRGRLFAGVTSPRSASLLLFAVLVLAWPRSSSAENEIEISRSDDLVSGAAKAEQGERFKKERNRLRRMWSAGDTSPTILTRESPRGSQRYWIIEANAGSEIPAKWKDGQASVWDLLYGKVEGDFTVSAVHLKGGKFKLDVQTRRSNVEHGPNRGYALQETRSPARSEVTETSALITWAKRIPADYSYVHANGVIVDKSGATGVEATVLTPLTETGAKNLAGQFEKVLAQGGALPHEPPAEVVVDKYSLKQHKEASDTFSYSVERHMYRGLTSRQGGKVELKNNFTPPTTSVEEVVRTIAAGLGPGKSALTVHGEHVVVGHYSEKTDPKRPKTMVVFKGDYKPIVRQFLRTGGVPSGAKTVRLVRSGHSD